MNAHFKDVKLFIFCKEYVDFDLFGMLDNYFFPNGIKIMYMNFSELTPTKVLLVGSALIFCLRAHLFDKDSIFRLYEYEITDIIW